MQTTGKTRNVTDHMAHITFNSKLGAFVAQNWHVFHTSTPVKERWVVFGRFVVRFKRYRSNGARDIPTQNKYSSS